MTKVTRKYLIDFVNTKFKALEINDYEVYDVEPTRFNIHQLEGGAACLYIRFRKIGEERNKTNHSTFYSFYKIKDLQWYVNNGYEMFIKTSRFTITDFELDIRKI